MIYRLEIENFHSIRDRQVLDLRVGRGVKDAPEKYAELFPGSTERVPKVIALFGANASGKTTVLRALSLLKWFLSESLGATPGWNLQPFNDEESASRPVFLAVEAATTNGLLPADIEKSRLAGEPFSLCRYELRIEMVEGDVKGVLREALLHKPMGKGKWIRIFERDAKAGTRGSDLFPLTGAAKLIADKARPDVSLVASLAQNIDHPAAREVRRSVSSIHTNVTDPIRDKFEIYDSTVARLLSNDPDLTKKLEGVLAIADVGIERIEVRSSPDGPILLFQHRGLRNQMLWINESHGTRSFIKAFLPISLALDHGLPVIQDEMDTQLHPLLVREVVSWFYSAERNPKNAQLWMTSHSASLLEDLAGEEVVLCEKDAKGRTSVYRLADVEGVRRDQNLYRKYLSGVYGAVPNFG